jgi:sugar phosphate isomerase/epimerase
MNSFPTVSRRDAIKAAAFTALSLPVLSGTLARAAGSAPAPVTTDRTHGLKLGVASYSLAKLSLDDVIAALGQLELKNVSLYKTHAPWDGAAEACVSAAKKCRDAGIAVTGTGVVNLPNDETVVRKAFDNARAAELPALVCKPEPDAYPLLDKFVKEYDLRLAIHNHGPEDKVYPSPYDAWKVIQAYDKRIGLCLDVGHAARRGIDPVEVIRTCRERLYDVHMKDSIAVVGATRDIPVEVGRGQLDIHGILSALIEVKYPHVVAFEYEKRGNNPVTGLAECVGYVRGMLGALG